MRRPTEKTARQRERERESEREREHNSESICLFSAPGASCVSALTEEEKEEEACSTTQTHRAIQFTCIHDPLLLSLRSAMEDLL